MKKTILRIVAALFAFILIGLIFSITNAFVGNPISKAIATRAIKSYVRENYSDMDLELSKASYNFKFNNYYIKAQSKTSQDNHFQIDYVHEKVTDTYESDVLSGWNTYCRLDNEFNHFVERLIKDNTPYEFDILFGGLDKSGTYQNSNLERDMEFNLNQLPLDGYVTAYLYSEDVSWDNVAKVTLELDQLMQKNNIKIEQYDVILEPFAKKEDRSVDSLGVYEFPQDMLDENDLPKVMKNYFEKREAEGDAKKDAEISNAVESK